jgi:hypothetical protein
MHGSRRRREAPGTSRPRRAAPIASRRPYIRAATSAVPHYRMWHQQITRASEAQERVVQAGVAFPADAEPAEVVQPGERSFHHPAHAAESRAVVGAAAGDDRFHASAPTTRDGTGRGHSRDRRSQSDNCDLVAERQGNRRAAPLRPRSGSPWPPTKRQTTPAICRNAGETGAKSGKTRTPYPWPEAREIPANRPVSDATAAQLKIVVSPVRVRVSPSWKGLQSAAFGASVRAPPDRPKSSRLPFPAFQRPFRAQRGCCDAGRAS